jgi:hypothetical protein
MSSRNEHGPSGRRFRMRDEQLRERVVQQYVRKWQLDNIAEETLRAVFAQCEFRFDAGGKYSFKLPGKIALNQQIRIAGPLKGVARDYRERVIRQLERIANVGGRIGQMVRGSLSNPLVFLAGKSPFDGYLTVCRNSGIHWGILRALQHLRDVITVTEETFFTDPTKVSMNWRLHRDRITPAMVRHVEKCLRPLDAQALHSPGCNRWLAGIQRFFEEVKAGTFRLADRPEVERLPGAGSSAAEGHEGQVGPSSPPQPAEAAEGLPGFQDGLRTLREHLLPHYLDLSPEDFAVLCRSDREAADFARRLGGAIERFAVRCLHVARREFLDGCGSTPTTDEAAEIGHCLRPLTEQAAKFCGWLDQELPQGENTVGRRLVELAESSLISGLFYLFLQTRFGQIFRELRDDGRRGAQRRVAANSPVPHCQDTLQRVEVALKQHKLELAAKAQHAETAAKLGVTTCCEDAVSGLIHLIRFAASLDSQEGKQPSIAAGKLAHRFLSAEAVCAVTADCPVDGMALVAHEPGAIPAVWCQFYRRAAEPGTAFDEVKVCRFSRRGGVALSPRIAIPASVLFGDDSDLAHLAEFLGGEANRHLAQWRQFAKTAGVRECLPFLENHGAQAARIEIRGGGSGDCVMSALPTAALAATGEFAESVALPRAIEQAAGESPTKEALLRALAAHWAEKGVAAADYSLCVLPERVSDERSEGAGADDERKWRRRVRRFLSQKNRWPLEEAEQILNALGIVIESKSDGAPHGKVRFNDRRHTLSSKLLKDGQVYSNYLHEWISSLGQERALAELLDQKDPRLASYMRRADAGEV